MELAPELAQQNPCHSTSDSGPNGGRACLRHQVAQHLHHDNQNECDYGGEQTETPDNRCRCPIATIAHCALPHPKPFHIAGANVNGWLTEADPTTCLTLGRMGVSREETAVGSAGPAPLVRHRRVQPAL